MFEVATEPFLIEEPIQYSIFSENFDWRDKKFTNPNSKIRVGTLFSGIGAIEHSFKRLNIKHEIVFAGDIDPQIVVKWKEKIGQEMN